MRLVCNSVGCLLLFSVLAFGQGGTGSLTGKLIDITGAGIWQAHIKLESERGDQYSAEPNSEGEFSFVHLLPGEYILKAESPGFQLLTVRAIRIGDGEPKTLPPLRLDIGSMACEREPLVQYIRLLDGETHTGDLGGRIQLDEGPMKGNTQGIVGAEVRLLCGKGGIFGKDVICDTTKTNQDGEFRFTGLDPGEFTLQVIQKGFYPSHGAHYRVDAGRESIYYPTHLEKCFRGNCDPSKRPKKPVALCF